MERKQKAVEIFAKRGVSTIAGAAAWLYVCEQVEYAWWSGIVFGFFVAWLAVDWLTAVVEESLLHDVERVAVWDEQPPEFACRGPECDGDCDDLTCDADK